MAKILAVKPITVSVKDKQGVPTGEKKPSIIVTTASGPHYVTPGQWKASGAGMTFGNFVGGNIDAIYFEEGEMLFDGVTKCTDSNKILKSVYLSENPVVLANALVVESREKFEEISDMATLYARNRANAIKVLAEKKAQLEGANAGAGDKPLA